MSKPDLRLCPPLRPHPGPSARIPARFRAQIRLRPPVVPGHRGDMHLHVSLAAFGPPHAGWLSWAGGRSACALGWAGICAARREGDGTTPAGVFALRRLWVRADRVPAVRCALPMAALSPAMGWCDAPGHAAYNRPVRLPCPASAERLWRRDGLYDLVLETSYNTPPRPGAGSAIFVHVARREGGRLAPTQGCVAVERDVLLAVLARLRPGSTIGVGARRHGIRACRRV